MVQIVGKDNRTFWMGISIIWIIGYHILIFHEHSFGGVMKFFKFLFFEGYVGVDVFLFLSAYGLCHSVTSNKLICYFKRRALRILPEYTLFLTICILLFCRHNIVAGVKDGVFQITSLSVLLPPPHFHGEWFTPAIINMYLFFPIVYTTIKKINQKWGLWGQVFILLFAILCTYFLRGYVSTNYLNRFPIILIGILTYINEQDYRAKRTQYIYVISAIFFFFIEEHGSRVSLLVPIILYGINDLSLNYDHKIVSAIKFIGKYSFELYLGQSICLSLCQDMNLIEVFVVMIIGTIVCASIFHFVNIAVCAALAKKL